MDVVDRHITQHDKEKDTRFSLFNTLSWLGAPLTPSSPSELPHAVSPGIYEGYAPNGGRGRDTTTLFHPIPPHAVEWTRDWLNNSFGPGAFTKTAFGDSWMKVFSTPQNAPGNNPGGVNTTATPGR
jgi:hypothetical protein